MEGGGGREEEGEEEESRGGGGRKKKKKKKTKIIQTNIKNKQKQPKKKPYLFKQTPI
jgi:hypothetical protein